MCKIRYCYYMSSCWQDKKWYPENKFFYPISINEQADRFGFRMKYN